MVFLGLVLTAAAVAVAVVVVMENTEAAQLTAFGDTVPGVNSQWQVFMAGAAVAVVLMAGLMLITVGIGRTMRLRRELRDLREEHEESVHTLEMENRQLQRELARARRKDEPGAATPPPQVPAQHAPQRTDSQAANLQPF